MLPASRATALVVALHLFAGGAGTATAFAPPLPLQHRAPRAGLDAHGAAFRRPALRQARAAPTRMVVLGGNSSPDDIRFESYSYELDGGKPLVVGLAGGTGSGKSTMMDVILRELVSHTPRNAGDEVAFLSHDNYYRHRTDLSAAERERINFDHPDSLETDLMVKHLSQLLEGKAVECPVYDFATHLRKEHETIRVEPRPIILVEGILIFTDPALREMMNLKIYVDVEADRRILRRIERDLHERDRSFDSVVSQYLETVKPMHDMYVEPSKKHADLIVPHGARNVAAIQVLLERLRAHLRATQQFQNKTSGPSTHAADADGALGGKAFVRVQQDAHTHHDVH